MSKVYGGVLCKDWGDSRTDEVIEVVRFADPDIADAWVKKHAEKRRCCGYTFVMQDIFDYTE
jgi:hypothetical protein